MVEQKQKTKNISRLKHPFFKCILLCNVMALMVIAGMQYHKIITIAAFLLAIVCIMFDNSYDFCYLVFLMFFGGVFKMNLTSTSLFTVLLYIYIIKLLFIHLQKKVKFSSFNVFLYVLFIGFTIINVNIDSLRLVLVVYLGLLLLILFFNKYKNNIPQMNEDVVFIIISFSLGIVVSSFFATVKEYIPSLNAYIINNSSSIKMENGFRIDRFAGLDANPNAYSLGVSIAIISLIILYDRKKIKISFAILVIPLLIFGFMTGSKSFIISLIVVIIIYIGIRLINDMKTGIKMILLLSGIVIVFMLIINDDTKTMILQRFSSDDYSSSEFNLNSFTTGRYDLLKNYLEYIFSSWTVMLIGDGIGSIYGTHGAHNYLVEVIHQVGIIGAIIYFGAIFRYMYVKKPPGYVSESFLLSSLPLLIFIIRSFAINLIARDTTYVYIILVSIMCVTSLKSIHNIGDAN
jgi:hypothetical protein